MEHEDVLDLAMEVMSEHLPQWVFEGVGDRVICSCGDRVMYSLHIKDLLRERVAANKKDEKVNDV